MSNSGPLKRQPPSAAAGLYFEENRVRVAQVRRSGQNAQLVKHGEFEMSGNLLEMDAAAAGAELRKKLSEAGISESRCVVALPLRIVMSFQAALPDLTEADAVEFLATEAERNFPYDPEDLSVAISRCRLPSGAQLATVAAVQRQQILHLQNVLKAAKMRVTSFVPAISSLSAAGTDSAVLLFLTARAAELEVTSGGGVAMLRSLENAFQENGAVAPDVIGRELRVTLGQLPEHFRAALTVLRVCGKPAEARSLLDALAPRLAALGLRGELAAGSSAQTETSPDAAFSAAANYLRRVPPAFEFLPPKVSTWKQFSTTSSARKLAWGGGILAAAALLVIGAFVIQNWQLSKLNSRWASMEPKVHELEDIQQQIRRFRPWFDTSFKNLGVLKKLTEAFPVDGVVSAKTVEIRNSSQVTCSGTARDNEALFRMLDQLRASKDVTDLKRDQVRGKNPVQFSFAFKLGEGGAGEH